MDTEDSDSDGKPNICPFCERGFTSITGLRQHWTKSHTEEEIRKAIEEKLNASSQLQPQTTPVTVPPWEKLQIISDHSNSSAAHTYHQLNIQENRGGGDCLFLAVFDFLMSSSEKFDNIPANVNDLRTRSVNHIVAGIYDETKRNFCRYKDSIITNLEQRFSWSSTNGDKAIMDAYSGYMSTPGEYGTTSELCAMSELFNFGFYVIREIDPENYTCYDYGSIKDDNERPVVILYFTGSIDRGHFRLLKPIDHKHCTRFAVGDYHLVKDYTSSRIKSISQGCFSETTDNQQSTDATEPEVLPKSIEEFINLLCRCKKNIRVLKRIPRGARMIAANKLAKCIEDCLAQPLVEEYWAKLITFSYAALRVPEKTKNVSLTTLVKRNIDNIKLVIPAPSKGRKPISLSKRIEYKIADGDVKGAVKLLSSNDTLAPQNEATLASLQAKHPPATNSTLPPPPDKNCEVLVVTEQEVVLMIGNFPNGAAAGVDGLLPQHLKDLTSPTTGEAGLRLVRAITGLSNLMLSGKVPSELCSILYGASLCALLKEEGGIRPIAVGNTFRRLTAKLACSAVRGNMAPRFAPKQNGFGTKGGCEATGHATRTFIKKNRNKKKVVLKIDFANAFNEIDRGNFLNEVKINCPTIYPFLWQCYSQSTALVFGEHTIWSQNGAQQGDPCGPLVFCLSIQDCVASLLSEFVAFYLDDGTIAGSYDSVFTDFNKVIVECGKIGLRINPEKCELFFCSAVDNDVLARFDGISPGIKVVDKLSLLGAPITEDACDGIFNKKLGHVKLLCDRLTELENYHIAFYLLKNCFAVPKLIYMLRTSPAWAHDSFTEAVDACIRSSLESITNTKLDRNAWIEASLPTKLGGLGVRRVQDLALPAFLSSVNDVLPLVSSMLNSPTLQVTEVSDYQDGLSAWTLLNPNTSIPDTPTSQKQWDQINTDRLSNELQLEETTDKARILALREPESSAWLHALPSRALGTLLNNNVFRISVGLRLGQNICTPHTCVCGGFVDSKGIHGLSCKKSAGRFSRHAELNEIIKRTLSTADIPSKLEPAGLVRNDGKRVDGMTLISWARGQTLIWDATCTDTLAPSNINYSAKESGKAAEIKAKRKQTKYQALIEQNYNFIPFAVETMGPWCKEAKKFVNELCKMITIKTNELRAKAFLRQRISMAIQRGNAASVMGTFKESEDMAEIFYLL